MKRGKELWPFLVAICLMLGTAGAAPPPNLLFLLADDLRWDALSHSGKFPLQTRNLDTLSREGTRFTKSFVSTAICCVSRASLLSGQSLRKHGIGDFAKPFDPEQWEKCYPALLKKAGYRLGFIGKFGLGDKNHAPRETFDYWRGFAGQGNYHFLPDQHLTSVMGDQALAFWAESPPSLPWCLSVSFKAPHAQDGAKQEFPPDERDERLLEDWNPSRPRTAADEFFRALPAFAQDPALEGRMRWQRRFDTEQKFRATTRDYLRLVAGIDREVGRMMAALERKGSLQNTVVIFTSDNGFFLGERGMADKWLPYEESIRVPLLVRDFRRPPGHNAPEVSAMALNEDIAPTLLDYASLPAPEGMSGRSLRPWVEKSPPRTWREDFFYEHNTLPKQIPPTSAVRSERWKYLRWEAPNPLVEELYDLQSDPEETRNLIASPDKSQIVEELRARWRVLRRS